MKLTKKQIEAIEIGGRDDEWEMSGDLSMDDARELRRLALLGLERDERAERIGRAVIESGFNVSDAEAVRTIYSWAGNGASRIVECMSAIADAMEDAP